MRPVIDYERAFEFPVTPSVLWETIEHTEQFETWWPWLREFRLDGGSLAVGSVLHGVVAPPVPYRMRVDVELIGCVTEQSIDALVHGDLEGDARLRFFRSRIGTRVEVAWTVEMMQAPMRLASRVARPVIKLGHDAVVEMTVARFRRQLMRGSRLG
jgi:hypothetical protein